MGDGAFKFAGVTTKLTKYGNVRKPAILKILRSGKVKVVTRHCHSDDTCVDFEQGKEFEAEKLARQIAEDGSTGWRAYPTEDGAVQVSNHGFRTLTIMLLDVTPEVKAQQEAYQAKLRAQAARARAHELGLRVASEARRKAVFAENADRLGAEVDGMEMLLAIKEAVIHIADGGVYH
jgi:hypothetical protein